jgi:hypothetical protein
METWCPNLLDLREKDEKGEYIGQRFHSEDGLAAEERVTGLEHERQSNATCKCTLVNASLTNEKITASFSSSGPNHLNPKTTKAPTTSGSKYLRFLRCISL